MKVAGPGEMVECTIEELRALSVPVPVDPLAALTARVEQLEEAVRELNPGLVL